MVRKISGFIIAVLFAYVLGAIAATRAVLQEPARMGVEVDFSTVWKRRFMI